MLGASATSTALAPIPPISYNARRMTPDRIAELLSPFLEGALLSESQLAQVAAYAALLEKWNARINLTAVRDPDEIVTRHFGESFFAASRLFPVRDASQTAIDVGSGAGFPGLPIKIWNPTLNLTLIEANQRKVAFLREAVRTLGLANVRVLAVRAEQVSQQADFVILRAVERFEQILPVALKLTAPSGRLALLIGNSQVELATSVLSGVEWQNPSPLPLSHSRSVLVGNLPA